MSVSSLKSRKRSRSRARSIIVDTNRIEKKVLPSNFKVNFKKPCIGVLRLCPKIHKLKTVSTNLYPCIYFPLHKCLVPTRIIILQDVHRSVYDAVYVLLTMFVALDINVVFFNLTCNKHLLSITVNCGKRDFKPMINNLLLTKHFLVSSTWYLAFLTYKL